MNTNKYEESWFAVATTGNKLIDYCEMGNERDARKKSDDWVEAYRQIGRDDIRVTAELWLVDKATGKPIDEY